MFSVFWCWPVFWSPVLSLVSFDFIFWSPVLSLVFVYYNFWSPDFSVVFFDFIVASGKKSSFLQKVLTKLLEG